MSRSSSAATTALVALILAVTGSAQAQTTFDPAYHRLSFKMLNTSANPFQYYLDGRMNHPQGVLPGQVQAAVDRAFQTWEDVACAYPAFTSFGLSSNNPSIQDPRDAFDPFNVAAIWVTDRNDPYYAFALASGGAAAAAVPLSYAGTLYQCDIYLNAVDYDWASSDTAPVHLADVESLVLHEIGHCMGLGHSDRFDDVMYPSYPLGAHRRTLQSRDIQMACETFPQSGAVGSPCLGDGGCGAQDLRCVQPPLADGGTGVAFCSRGCDPQIPRSCEDPFVCKPSNLIQGSPGTCLSSGGDYVTQVGAPCGDASECGSPVSLCQTEGVMASGFPAWEDGYCTQECGPGKLECPAGAACVDFGGGVERCIKTCRLGTGDCRFGYSCVRAADEVNLCWPSCHADADCDDGTGSYLCRTCDGTCVAKNAPAAQIGDPCTATAQCGIGQVCLFLEGKELGICSQPCAHACTACPGGSTCHPFSNGELYCLRDCTAGSCPAGLQCGLLASGRGCIPGCTANEECPVGSTCSGGQCTNPHAQDGGTCTLCPDPNDPLQKPHAGPDAGAGGGTTSGGCGCTASPGALALLLPWSLVLVLRGRRREKSS